MAAGGGLGAGSSDCHRLEHYKYLILTGARTAPYVGSFCRGLIAVRRRPAPSVALRSTTRLPLDACR